MGFRVDLRRIAARMATVRAKATVVSMVVVGAALVAGSFGLIGLLRSSMTEGVEATARAQLNDVTALAHLGNLPRVLPAGEGDILTQVVGRGGQVLASSANLVDSSPISDLQPGEEGAVVETIPNFAVGRDTDGPFLLMAMTSLVAGVAGSPVTVYVAGSLRPIDEATRTVAAALVAGLPVLVVLVGVLVWWFAGRALRPVEAIRAEVADISGHGLHRRVPEPASNDEIARLARTMNEMLNRLESFTEARRRFTADASHELRSPLANLQATLEVALAHPTDASWTATASEALDELQGLQQMVDDLLVLARAEQPVEVSRSHQVDVDELVMAEARRLRARSSISLDLHRTLAGRVQGDPGQLARMVRNLMDNAARHASSRVEVELSSDRGEVVLAVDDDGPGIPPSERERIFEPFARLDEARSREGHGGTGLGLAIVRDIVVAHGGSVSAVASPLGGARFVVRLPASG
jgi:signal transduction histidine kinase